MVNLLVVESPDYPANRQLLSRRDTPKFNSEHIRRSVMHDLTVQSQSVFLVNQ
jgi:hypothetical protein